MCTIQDKPKVLSLRGMFEKMYWVKVAIMTAAMGDLGVHWCDILLTTCELLHFGAYKILCMCNLLNHSICSSTLHVVRY